MKDLEANVLVTDNISGQFRNFKFNIVSAIDGQFSVKYLFPDTDCLKSLQELSPPDVQALAAFDVIVPKITGRYVAGGLMQICQMVSSKSIGKSNYLSFADKLSEFSSYKGRF